MKKLVTILLLITIFSCALVLVGCTVNKDKNGDQIGQSNTLTTDPIVGRYKYVNSNEEKEAYYIINKDGTIIGYEVRFTYKGERYCVNNKSNYSAYWAYNKDTNTYDLYQLNPISGEKVNAKTYTSEKIKSGVFDLFSRITDDEWPDCIPEE